MFSLLAWVSQAVCSGQISAIKSSAIFLLRQKCNCQMGYWVASDYWLIIQSFNEQTAIINIYTFTFKNWNEYILTLKQP